MARPAIGTRIPIGAVGNAVAADVRADKTFSSATAGTGIQGSAPVLPTKIWTPGTVDQKIAAGSFLDGEQTIKGEPNLIAANIPLGIKMFNIDGSMIPTPSNFTTATVNKAEAALTYDQQITATIFEFNDNTSWFFIKPTSLNMSSTESEWSSSINGKILSGDGMNSSYVRFFLAGSDSGYGNFSDLSSGRRRYMHFVGLWGFKKPNNKWLIQSFYLDDYTGYGYTYNSQFLDEVTIIGKPIFKVFLHNRYDSSDPSYSIQGTVYYNY